MTEKTFTIENKLGLHARPASLFVQASSRHKCSVKVSKDVNGNATIEVSFNP